MVMLAWGRNNKDVSVASCKNDLTQKDPLWGNNTLYVQFAMKNVSWAIDAWTIWLGLMRFFCDQYHIVH
jgi:hypothetical protein